MKASILFALAVLVSVSWAEEALPCSPDLPLGSQPISLSTFCQQNPETPGNEQPDQGLGLQDAAGNPGVAWQDCGPYAAPCDSLLSAPPAPQVMPSHLESSPQDFLPPAEHPIASQAQGEEPAGAANSGRSHQENCRKNFQRLFRIPKNSCPNLRQRGQPCRGRKKMRQYRFILADRCALGRKMPKAALKAGKKAARPGSLQQSRRWESSWQPSWPSSWEWAATCFTGNGVRFLAGCCPSSRTSRAL